MNCHHCNKKLGINAPATNPYGDSYSYWCIECLDVDRELLRASDTNLRSHFSNYYIDSMLRKKELFFQFCGWDRVLNSIPKRKILSIKRLKCLKGSK
jgi:hypothetical protein